MHFCKSCKNKLSIKTSNEDINAPSVKYYCKSCSYETNNIHDNEVYKNNYNEGNLGVQGKINEYTPLDPTLPRISSINCPNDKCPSRDSSSGLTNEIVYMMYDQNNLKNVYICTHCLHRWNNA